jgi:hypothetical protein
MTSKLTLPFDYNGGTRNYYPSGTTIGAGKYAYCIPRAFDSTADGDEVTKVGGVTSTAVTLGTGFYFLGVLDGKNAQRFQFTRASGGQTAKLVLAVGANTVDLSATGTGGDFTFVSGVDAIAISSTIGFNAAASSGTPCVWLNVTGAGSTWTVTTTVYSLSSDVGYWYPTGTVLGSSWEVIEYNAIS